MMNYRLCKNALIVIFKRCQQNGAVNQIRRKCIQDILYIFDEGLKVRMCKELIKLGNKKTNKNLKLGKQSQKAFHQ